MLKARPSSVNFRAHRAPWREHLQQTKIARGGAVRQSSAPSFNLCLFHMWFCLNFSCIPLIADTFYMPFLSVDQDRHSKSRTCNFVSWTFVVAMPSTQTHSRTLYFCPFSFQEG